MRTSVDAGLLEELQDSSFERAGAATRTSYPSERRMSGATLFAFLNARFYLIAATTRPDGRPHIAPTSYLLHEGAIWLPTTAGAARLTNIAHTPYVSLALVEGEGESHAALLMEGAAATVDAVDAPTALLEAWRHRAASDGGWIESWIVVNPARLLSYAAPGWRGPTGPQLA
jgi:nitroimidazol reductase NimA-like FMN-containing flavoprotein (pyridoxamine 5'-phosphate oxidase superfamily)